MDDPYRDVDRRASLCPHCKIVHGQVMSLGMGHGVRILHYRCPTCSHVWDHTELLPDTDGTGDPSR
jgi:rubredoxin